MESAVRPDYRQTIDYLYGRLPMFSRIGAAAIKKDLTNTLALCEVLGNPQKSLRTVHIAGTNGKGSTSHMLAAIFQNAGYKTGLYTSPHLIDFRERIRINGIPVGETFVVDFVADYKSAIESIEPSFFEITVAMAFEAFRQESVDIAIIETGLGGRLDSTNVIVPELSIITNISLDHVDMLGDTITAIAGEKAGIIKEGVPILSGTSESEATAVFRSTANNRHSTYREANDMWRVSAQSGSEIGLHRFIATSVVTGRESVILTDLGGNFQQENLATVLSAVDILKAADWNISQESAAAALREVKASTGLRGRWDMLNSHPVIIADVGHNAAGLGYVLKDWQSVTANAKHIIVGFVKDKDVRSALRLFPRESTYHFCAADIPRALPAAELAILANEEGLNGSVYASVREAVTFVRREMDPNDALLITGSFFIVGEAMQALQ